MSQSYVAEERIDIANYKEIVFIFLVFATVLYFIYPKDMLQKQVLKEKSNYALSALYIDNMLKIDPKNRKLIFAAVKADLNNGKIDLANKLIEVLKNNTNTDEEKKIALLEYKLYSIQQEKNKDENRSIKIEKNIAKLIYRVSKFKNFDEDYAFVWYKNALAHSKKEEALSFIKPIYERGDTYALEQCTQLAHELKKIEEKLYCTEKLINLDHNRSKHWLESAYNMYTQSGNTVQAYKMIKELASIDHAFIPELARVELIGKHFIDSSKSFMVLYKNSTDEDKKKQYLLNAIQVLFDGKKIVEVVILIKKYEDTYITDENMTQKFIKLYLSADRLKDARELSIKLMKGGSFE
jgi:hypothetical protein